MAQRRPAPAGRPRQSSRPRAAHRDSPPASTGSTFPIVGIGASAGGLEAMLDLLGHLPQDSGMAFVFVQHMGPKHDSRVLPELLSRHSSMAVSEVSHGASVEPDKVWVATAQADVTIVSGRWSLSPRETVHGRHMPIDLFLRSLADVQRHRAIGVILSGSGTDGTEGVKAIKLGGGVALAQDPQTAKFDSMPRSAIASGFVDLVLPPEGLAREVVRLGRDPYVISSQSEPKGLVPLKEDAQPLEAILRLVKATTRADFASYRKTTIVRRIRRRMAVNRAETLTEYAHLLEGNAEEVRALRSDILINVTSFFRDPGAFRALAETVLPSVFEDKSADAPFRAWIPGCATGEEAYSVAISLLECAGAARASPTVQVFGTDVSEWAIERARAGRYTANIASDVSPERLARFFAQIDGHLQVSRSVRDLCVFACHDVTRDPPFSRMDLITCRNLLIYLEPELQNRVLQLFHYALNPSGHLMLGEAETIGIHSDLFALVSREHKIYTKRVATHRPVMAFTRNLQFDTRAPQKKGTPAAVPAAREAQKEADRVLLSRYAPSALLVDDDLQILQFRGDTEAFVGHPEGDASLSLLKTVRRDLLVELRAALQEARATGAPVRKDDVRFRTGGKLRKTHIEVIPIHPIASRQRCFLILFEEGRKGPPPRPVPPGPPIPRGIRAQERRIAELEAEIAAVQQYQKSLVEEHEAANEELQSASEEILSSNEELQSINEELETAKEELQSNNEELSTLNDELSHRNLELSQLGDDLNNLLSSLDIPILMVNDGLMVRKFTPAAAKLFNLLPTDAGRALGSVRSNVETPDLGRWVLETIEAMTPGEHEVRDSQGRWYSLRIRPYRTKGNTVDGAVLIFLDVDALKQSLARLEAARAYAEAIVDTVRQPLLILDGDLRVRTANASFYETFRVSPQETEGRPLDQLGDGHWDIPELRAHLLAGPFEGYEVTHTFPHIGRRVLTLNARRLQEVGADERILFAVEDHTEIRRAEEELQANRFKDEFLATLSHELRGPLNAMAGWTYILMSARPLDEATTARALAAVDHGVKAQLRLIEDLLDVSRIMAGRLSLSRSLVDLVRIAEAALLAVQPVADARRIRVALMPHAKSVWVWGDPDRLQQIVWNILSNGVKFTSEEGHVELRLGTEADRIEVSVRDDGLGIAAEFLPHVFERFRQAESGSARRYPGLGLGLAIVRHLVDLHGGSVRAESPGPGLGSTFTVVLPLPPLEVREKAHETVESRAPEVVLEEGGGLLQAVRVLVVDDDPETRGMLAFVFSRCGAQVTEAASARDALAALSTRPMDVLVSDIAMPEMDGLALIRRVRALAADEGGQIPALALTAYAGWRDRADALSAGFQAHIAKPIGLADMLRKVATLAGRGHVAHVD